MATCNKWICWALLLPSVWTFALGGSRRGTSPLHQGSQGRDDVLLSEEEDCGHLYGYGDPTHEASILQTIAAAQRGQSEVFGGDETSVFGGDETTSVDLTDLPRVDVYATLKKEARTTLCAEFKRASPSKGPIDVDADVEEVARAYAEAGASLISVLTEKKWFQGSLEDMAKARLAVDAIADRPAILRKDFVVDERMIREARRFGADAVLLIVACLRASELFELVAKCFEYGVEPVVEAHSEREMELALKSGARVLGVNNRNLHTFQLDMTATARLAKMIPPQDLKDVVALASLSGVATRADVVDLVDTAGVCSVLVGETLMRAADKRAAVRTLLGSDDDEASVDDSAERRLLAKVCGVCSAEDAVDAARRGADLIGMVFAPASKRCLSTETGATIVEAIRKFGERNSRWTPPPSGSVTLAQKNANLRRATARGRPLTVAVVQNQPLEDIRKIIDETGVDLVQLHGDEDDALASKVGPHLRVVHAVDDTLSRPIISDDCHAVLVDTAGGGTGQRFDWSLLRTTNDLGEVLVAGGVDAAAVDDAAKAILFLNKDEDEDARILGFDASSRLEESPGLKDHDKVAAYLAAVKRASPRGSAP